MAKQKKNPETIDDSDLKKIKYRKSNHLIQARGKSTALVQKLFTVGIAEAKEAADGSINAVIPGTELRRIFGCYSGSFYDSVKLACDSGDLHKPDLLSWRLRFESAEKGGTFDTLNVVTRATFSNGTLKIKFNPDIKDDISGLTQNYTELYQYIVVKMKSPYSILLYERFQSEMDYQRAANHGDPGPYKVIYPMEDLRDIFGLDYEIAEKNGKKKTYHLHSEYSDFRRNTLEVCEKEINEIAPMTMSYEPIRSGRGGKVVAIRFTLTRKVETKRKDKAALTKEELTARKIVFADAVALLSDDIGVSEIKAICEAADYDMEKIQKAYDLAQKSKGIQNLTGWMIKAIQDGYGEVKIPATKKEKEGTKKKSSGRKKKGSFQDYEQTDYDFDELEKGLLAN